MLVGFSATIGTPMLRAACCFGHCISRAQIPTCCKAAAEQDLQKEVCCKLAHQSPRFYVLSSLQQRIQKHSVVRDSLHHCHGEA